MKKILILSVLAFLINGCVDKEPKPKTLEKKEIKTKKEKKQPKKELKLSKDGLVKGTIREIHYIPEKKVYYYVVNSKLATDDSLVEGRFFANKKINNVGDQVYALIIDQKLADMHVIKKAKSKQVVNKDTNQTKLQKRTLDRKTPWINPPKSEPIKVK